MKKLLLTLALVAFLGGIAMAQSLPTQESNLDRPISDAENVEAVPDPPNNNTNPGGGTFYGESFTGHVVYVCDRSCSMGYSGNPRLIIKVRNELNASIQALDENITFGVIWYDSTSPKNIWAGGNKSRTSTPMPVKATASNKASAISWNNTCAVAGGGTRYLQAVVRGIEMLKTIQDNEEKQVMFLSDGYPGDYPRSSILTSIAAAKGGIQGTFKLNTIQIGGASPMSIMQQMASQNGGTFRHVP